MWFSNVFLKTTRGYWIPILGWGVGMGLAVVSPMASVDALLKSPQARQQLVGLAASFSWNAEPVALTTIGGYATWKIGTFIFLMAIWPLLAASRTLRGEEVDGALDVLLSLPQSRTRIAIEKVAALWVALVAMGMLVGLLAFAGGRASGATFGPGGALLFGVNLTLVCTVIGGVALLISQFTAERGQAAGWTAGLLLVFIVVDMVHRVIPNTGWISHFSPLYYYNLSKPLIPTYGVNPGAMFLLLGVATALNAAAIALFVRRDINGTVPVPRWLHVATWSGGTHEQLPAHEWTLTSILTRSIRTVVWPTVWWTLGIAGLGAWMVIVVGQTESQLSTLLRESSAMRAVLQSLSGGGEAGITAAFLSAMFGLLPLFLMAFAVTQVNRWSADEQEGRLDLVLATPASRSRVLLARFAALGMAVVTVSLITLLAAVAAAAISGLSLDRGNLASAALGMIPLAWLIAAIGYLGAGWLRTAADTGLLSFLLLTWFFISFIGPDLNWPGATLWLSAFHYYGTPLLHGLQPLSLVGVIVASAIALGLAVTRFARKDIA